MSKLKYKLGDHVEYTAFNNKIRCSIGTYKTKVSRVNINLPEPKHGIVIGYRNMPVGEIQYNEEVHEFKQKGTVGCYLVAFNMYRKYDYVCEEFISPYIPTENTSPIISPYEETLIKVKHTIRYEKYGYIYRNELIGFSLNEMDEQLDMKVCYSLDGQYLGNNKIANMLCRKFGIREFVKTAESHWSACVGFNPVEQKWYGWSHRAIYGFGIGSTVKKGDCGYMPKDEGDMLDDLVQFWVDDEDKYTYLDKVIESKIDHVHREEFVTYGPGIASPGDTPTGDTPTELAESSRSFGTPRVGVMLKVKTTFKDGRDDWINEYFKPYPQVWGKGEWTAKTLEDAKQMASDFAEGVS